MRIVLVAQPQRRVAAQHERADLRAQRGAQPQIDGRTAGPEVPQARRERRARERSDECECDRPALATDQLAASNIATGNATLDNDSSPIYHGFPLTAPVVVQLELTLSYNAGSVEGTITDAASKPVSGVQAVLIPDQRERRELFKTAITDQSGKVTFRGVTPGTYRLFAWEDLEPYSYFDPEVLRQYEQQGKLVNVKESANAVIDMKIIPASVP